MKRTLLSTLLLAAALSAGAAEQRITMTTSKAVGETMILVVNATRSGVTVDWGDGTPVSYVPDVPGGLQTIVGTVAGPDIVVTAPKGLFTFCAENCGLTSIALTEAPELQSLYLQHNALASVNVASLPGLKDLNVADNALTSITLSSTTLPDIETLNLADNALTASTFSYGQANLQYLNLANNNYRTVTLTKDTALDALIVSGNNISTLNLAAPTELSLLDARDNALTRLTLPTDGLPKLEQACLDNNSLSEVDLSASTGLNTLTIASNGASLVNIYSRAPLQVYDCSDNALTFASLPGKNYQPTVYFAYAPQAPFDLSGLGLNAGSWGSNYLPWLTMNPDYASRSNAAYQLDLSAQLTGSGVNTVSVVVNSVTADGETVLQQASAAHKDLDYTLISGKMTVLKPYEDLYLTFSDTGYPDLVITTSHFAVIDPTADGIGTVIADDQSAGAATYDLSGRRVSKPAGLVIEGGKKIFIK